MPNCFVFLFIILVSNYCNLLTVDGSMLQCYTCAGTCHANLFRQDQHRVSSCPNTTRGCFKYVLNNDGRHSTYRGCARVLDETTFCSAVKVVPGSRLYACSTCPSHLCNSARHTSPSRGTAAAAAAMLALHLIYTL